MLPLTPTATMWDSTSTPTGPKASAKHNAMRGRRSDVTIGDLTTSGRPTKGPLARSRAALLLDDFVLVVLALRSRRVRRLHHAHRGWADQHHDLVAVLVLGAHHVGAGRDFHVLEPLGRQLLADLPRQVLVVVAGCSRLGPGRARHERHGCEGRRDASPDHERPPSMMG